MNQLKMLKMSIGGFFVTLSVSVAMAQQCLFFRRMFRSGLALSLAGSMMIPVLAGKKPGSGEASASVTVSINNFGKVNEGMYRGGQPQDRNYQELVDLGVKTIVDLRGDAERGSQQRAERAGLRYINLPLEPKQYPQADAAARFLEIVNNPANAPVYVHCAGGRHRTGAMIAVYRITMDQWTVSQAYDEMKRYDFYTSRGHGCYKDYVYDYHRDFTRQRQTVAGTSRQSSAPGN